MALSTPNLQGFSLGLLNCLSSGRENVFFSPHSVASALMLACLGAKGDTFEQIVTALEFDTVENVHGTFKRLNDGVLGSVKDGIEINIANNMYTSKELRLLELFVEELKKYYDGGVEPIDFVTTPDACREMINKWVEEQTKEKIKDLLQPDAITPQTKMVVVNAIYFKGFWDKPFKLENTKADYFHVTPEVKVKVQMMKDSRQLQYLTDSDLDISAVAIPYQGGQLSMIILLPNEINGLGKVGSELTKSRLQEFCDKLLAGRKYGVDISLPRFKMTEESELRGALQQIGVTDLFNGKINLSGMFESNGPPIDRVIHKAFIDVNEEGTEAAAATAMISRMMVLPVENAVFRCDHPFMFFIVENKSRCILFMGKLYNPE